MIKYQYVTRSFFLIFIFFTLLISQPDQRRPGGSINGRVYDTITQEPIEYANIVLYRQGDSTQVTGTTTDKGGQFQLTRLRPGEYYLEIYFLGYETDIISDIKLDRGHMRYDLGQVKLKPAALSGESVEVMAERAPISYQIDKKVIDVDQQFSSLSGNAVEVLENVPSVSVDIEGNVSLRGSENFRLLIDGRPSVLEPSEALQQLPASTLDRIEIITNPSAKYDPEGNSGIINVILKKTKQAGRSGIANLDAGINDKYGADFIFEYKKDKYTGTIGVDYNNRIYAGDDLEKNITSQAGITSFINSDGTSHRGRESFGLRGELAYDLSPGDLLTLGGRYGNRTSSRDASLDYDEWSDAGARHNMYNSITERQRSGSYLALYTSYRHRFEREGHELSTDLFFSRGDGDECTINELVNENSVVTLGHKTLEWGPGRDFRGKFDYARPLGQKDKFEWGYQIQIDKSDDNTALHEYDPDLGDYVPLPEFSNYATYQRDVQAVYSLYSGEWKNLGFQGGIRGEYTYRLIEVTGENENFAIDRWDYFPTVHISYQFSGGQQSMASYTRRIHRPRGWYLEPFETRIDAYNVRVGNPSLKPEYIDSYEMSYQTFFGKNMFSAEIYYRVTHNRIDRVRSVYDQNVTLHSMENTGEDYALGSEFMLNLDVSRNWNMNLLANLYDYRIEGVLYEQSFSRKSFNWSARLSNKIKLGKALQIQLDGHYRSPTVSSQGRREGFFMTNIAFKYEIIANQLSSTLQIRDLFSTGKFEYTAEGQNFYSYRYSTRESPLVMLNLRFNLNNYKKRRQPNQETAGMGEEDEF